MKDTWKDINKIEIDNNTIYLKKGFDGYKVVYPYKNENGAINWFNLFTSGSYWNILKVVLFVMAILLPVIFYYFGVVKECESIINNRCEWCFDVSESCYQQENMDFPNFTLNQEVRNGKG